MSTFKCEAISCTVLPKTCTDFSGNWVAGNANCGNNQTNIADQVGNSEGNDITKRKCCAKV